jgi:hypothetical protein
LFMRPLQSIKQHASPSTWPWPHPPPPPPLCEQLWTSLPTLSSRPAGTHTPLHPSCVWCFGWSLGTDILKWKMLIGTDTTAHKKKKLFPSELDHRFGFTPIFRYFTAPLFVRTFPRMPPPQ